MSNIKVSAIREAAFCFDFRVIFEDKESIAIRLRTIRFMIKARIDKQKLFSAKSRLNADRGIILYSPEMAR